MNPWGLLLVGIGLILIIIGFKGSQHGVLQAFTGKLTTAAAGNPGPPVQLAAKVQKTANGSLRAA
jgi:hypothetical protein